MRSRSTGFVIYGLCKQGILSRNILNRKVRASNNINTLDYRLSTGHGFKIYFLCFIYTQIKNSWCCI